MRSTHNILTSLFRKSKKKPIWMPKTTSEAARAVTKATRLIPVESWALPAPSAAEVVASVAARTGDGDAPRGADKVALLIGRVVGYGCRVGCW